MFLALALVVGFCAFTAAVWAAWRDVVEVRESHQATRRRLPPPTDDIESVRVLSDDWTPPHGIQRP